MLDAEAKAAEAQKRLEKARSEKKQANAKLASINDDIDSAQSRVNAIKAQLAESEAAAK